MMERKTVTVFGSSKPLPGEEEYEIGYRLGAKLGKAGFNVCTGGYHGIMDAVSKGAAEQGTEAIGVTVSHFKGDPSGHLTRNIKSVTLLERLSKLIEHGDAYIILQGGTGTLVELALIWEYINKGLMQKKPAACHGMMWRTIVDEMEARIEKEKRQVGLVRVFDEIDLCADYIIGSLTNSANP